MEKYQSSKEPRTNETVELHCLDTNGSSNKYHQIHSRLIMKHPNRPKFLLCKTATTSDSSKIVGQTSRTSCSLSRLLHKGSSMWNVIFVLVPHAPGTPSPRVNRLRAIFSAVVANIEARSLKSWSCVVMIRSRKLNEDILEVKW